MVNSYEIQINRVLHYSFFNSKTFKIFFNAIPYLYFLSSTLFIRFFVSGKMFLLSLLRLKQVIQQLYYFMSARFSKSFLKMNQQMI